MVNVVKPRKVLKDRGQAKVKSNSLEIDKCTCCKCGELGHIRSRCYIPKKEMAKPSYIFANGDGDSLLDNHWILDRGSSRHLVNDPNLLIDPIDC